MTTIDTTKEPPSGPFMVNLIFLPEIQSSHTVETVLTHLNQAGHGVTACVCSDNTVDQPTSSIHDKFATVVKVDVNGSVDAILNQAIAQLHQKYTFQINDHTTSSYIPKPTDPFNRHYHESFAAYRQSSAWYTSLSTHINSPRFSLYTPRPPALLDAQRRNCFHYRPFSHHSNSILHISPTAHRINQIYPIINKIPLMLSFFLFIYNHRDFFVPNLRVLLDLDLTNLIKSLDLIWTSFAQDVQNYMFEIYLQTL